MSDGYPSTLYEIKRAGYTLLQTRPCHLCRKQIERWRTTRGKEIYFDPMQQPNDEAVPHRSTCTKQQPGARRGPSLQGFAASQQAAAVVIVDAKGEQQWVLADSCLIEPSDIHAAIVSAANEIQQKLCERFGEGQA